MSYELNDRHRVEWKNNTLSIEEMSEAEQKMQAILDWILPQTTVLHKTTFDGLCHVNELYCDFYLPKYNLVIEIDEHPKHFYDDKQIQRDTTKNRILLEKGVHLLRFDFFNCRNDFMHTYKLGMHLEKFISHIQGLVYPTYRFVGQYRSVYPTKHFIYDA